MVFDTKYWGFLGLVLLKNFPFLLFFNAILLYGFTLIYRASLVVDRFSSYLLF